MPLFSRSRSSSSNHQHHNTNTPSSSGSSSTKTKEGSSTPSNTANRPSSSSGLGLSRSSTPVVQIQPSPNPSASRPPSSPSSIISNFINRKRSSSANLNSSSNSSNMGGREYPSSISLAAPEAAKAYLAALAARTSSSPSTNLANGQQQLPRHNSTTSSSASSDDSSSLYTGTSSISSFSDVGSFTSTNSASSAISSAASSLASSLPSPSSLLKRKRNNTQSHNTVTSPNGNATNGGGGLILGRKRGLSESIANFTLHQQEDKIVYSNDYHVPLKQSEALKYFSKHPPLNASKIAPTRHFDADPFYVPEELKNDPLATRHSEFGYTAEKFEYKSQYRKSTGVGGEEIEEPSHFIYLTTYMSYLLLIVVGHMRDFIGKRTHRKSYQHLMPYNGYAALNSDFDSFYTRRLKARIEDLFSRPVTGVAGRTITCLDRVSLDHYATFRFTGLTTQALNISSYNYLGFNQSKGGCADAVEEVIKTYGVSSLGNREDVGTLDLHIHAERLIAKFLGVEDSLLISQGFATNSATLPILVSKGCLVISDEFNHASIRFGVRLSGAVVKQYKHNDMKDLEKLLRESISQGQPRTHRPWKKIMLIVEGLYSMEGSLVDLPRILELKRKYKFYLYVDEAHSVGALGPKGRGVCDYFNVDPGQVDILMGTLTKSFGAAGGYIAGSKEMISEMRRSNHSSVYGEAHSPAVLMQIISAIVCIMGGKESLEVIPGLEKYMNKKMLDGTEGLERLRRLAFNSRYLSTGLRKLGFIVYGHRDSPIVPLLMFSPGKMGAFSRLMLEKFNIVTVVVAYPATPLVSSRVRFCVSAAHTKQDIDRVLIACDVIGDILGLKLSSQHKRMKVEDIIKNSRMLVESD